MYIVHQALILATVPHNSQPIYLISNSKFHPTQHPFVMLKSIIIACLLISTQANADVVYSLSKMQEKSRHDSAFQDQAISGASQEYTSFRHVFGQDRLHAHYASELDLLHSVRRATLSVPVAASSAASSGAVSSRQAQEREQEHNYLACGGYGTGRALKLLLEGSQGRAVATAFTSHAENRACFTVTASAATLEAIDFTATPLFTLEVVPKSLKIHQSVVFGMNLHPQGLSASEVLSPHARVAHQRMAAAYSKPVDLSKTALVVSSNKKRASIFFSQSATATAAATASSLRASSASSQTAAGQSSEQHGRRMLNTLLAGDHSHMESETPGGALASLHLLSEDAAHSQHSMWRKALLSLTPPRARDAQTEERRQTSSSASCAGAFSHLQFDSSASNRVTIRNLDSIRQAVSSASASSSSFAQGGVLAEEEVQKQVDERAQACFVQLLAVLAADPETIDVRFRHPQRKLNNVIKGIVQAKERARSYPYLNRGLDGLGQVVGLADTGVDEYSCFFSNDDGTLVTRSSHTAPTFNHSKRKIVQYIDYQDGGDGEEGHGSHCSGSVLGFTPNTTFMDHAGHAGGAKLAFFDMENTADQSFGFRISMEEVLNCAYVAGARVSSNSYGGMSNEYDDDTLGVDAFSNDHDDYLALFAAGNEGNEGYYSLSGASIAKNSVGVGASESQDGSDIGNMAYFSSIGPTFDNRIKPDVVAPGHKTWSARSSGRPSQTCEIAGMSGTSMATPATAGVAAQLRQYFEDTSFWATVCASPTTASTFVQSSRLCTGGAFSPRGATVKALLVHSGEPMKKYNSPAPYCYGYGGGDEPDALNACGTCNGPNFGDCVTCKAGYEIRVYYADCSGWCVPEGTSDQTPEDVGCVPGEGYSNDEAVGSTREPAALFSAGVPDMFQGFGRIALPNVLPLAGVQEDIQLFVSELELAALKQTSFVLTFATNQTVPLKITLCWMDPTNAVFSAKMLLHDLDLVVESRGKKWYGNRQAGDERNNVEQITINNPWAGDYTVSLLSKVFTESETQKVSLTVTAAEIVGTPFTTTDISEDFLDNELSCADGEAMITVILLDNGADGWGEGSSFELRRKSDRSVVWSSSMTREVSKDAYLREVVCVSGGEYDAVMVQGTDDSSAGQMGVEIDECFIHLSATVLSRPLTVSGGACNACPDTDTIVTLQLTGSPYSIPYGWKDDTQYVMTSSRGRVDMGRLVMGINTDHRVCLPNAEYHLGFDSVAEGDDWLDDQSDMINYADNLGVGEYSIKVSDVNLRINNYVRIDTTNSLTIRVHDNTAHVVTREQPFTVNPTSQPTSQPSQPPSVPSSEPSSVPSPIPSVRPSGKHGGSVPPTAVPVPSRTVVSFRTSVGMTGVSAANFDAAATNAFASTVAAGIDGVTAQDVSNIVVVDVAAAIVRRSVSSADLHAQGGGRVSVTYSLTVVMQNMPGGHTSTASLVSSMETSMVRHFSDPATSTSWVTLSLSMGSSLPADTVAALGVPVVDQGSIHESVVSTRSPTAASQVLDGSDGGGSGGVNLEAVYISVGIIVGIISLGILVYVFRSEKRGIRRAGSDAHACDDVELSTSVNKHHTDNPLLNEHQSRASGNL